MTIGSDEGLPEKVEYSHVKNKVAKEPVRDCSIRRKGLPAIIGVLAVAFGELHAEGDGEDENTDAGEEAGEERVERERANGHGVDKLCNARGKHVAQKGVDDL